MKHTRSMRRWFVLSLAFLLLISCASASASSFSFSNGITWDTTPAQMLAAEGVQEGGGGYNEQAFEGYTFFYLKAADIYYVFRGDSLVMAYSLLPRGAFDAALAEQAALYGAPADIPADTVGTLLNLVIPDSAGPGDVGDLAAWRLPDGTLAALFAIGELNFRVYFHEQRILAGQ